MHLLKNYITPKKLTGFVFILLGFVFILLIKPLENLWQSDNSIIKFLIEVRNANIKIGSPVVLPGLNFKNIHLLFFNIGLAIIIFSNEKYEDERVDKIRNYTAKVMFRVVLVTLILITAFFKNPNVFLATLYFQTLYIVLFRVCLYRDSALVYLDHNVVKKYFEKNPKQFYKYSLPAMFSIGILGAIAGYFQVINMFDGMIICSVIYNFALIIFWHWKSESFISKQL